MEDIRNKSISKTLRIKDIEVFALKIPLKKPIKMSGITVSFAENIFIKVISEDNIYGWGEASSAPTMTGEFVEGMYAAANYIKKQLIGLEIKNLLDLNILKKMPIYENKGTLSAFEMGLIDLILKSEKSSFQKFMNFNKRNKIPIIQMVAGSSVDEEIDNVKKSVSNGFSRFKIKVGSSNSYEHDLSRCKKIIESVDKSCFFSADANEGFSFKSALEFSKLAKDCGLKFFEQPVPSQNLEHMKTLTAESSVPICSDEGVHSMSDILSIIFNKSSNGISLKTIKLGGMIDVLESAIYASTKNISINLAGKVAETSISSYAIANIARCIPQMDWDLSITNQYLEEDPVINPLLLDNGNILLTDLIGLGAELNMEVAHKYIKYV